MSGVLADLLKVEPDNWMLRLNAEGLFKILNDDGLFQKWGCGTQHISGRQLRERILLLNLILPRVRFDMRTEPVFLLLDNPNAIDPEKGLEIVLGLLSALGLQ